MTKRAPKVIDIYARISKDPDNDERGVTRQVKQVRENLARQGFAVGEVIIDNDISASRYERKVRPGFKRVCERIASRDSGGVAAYHWKRLIRRPREGENFIDLIEDSGARVLTVASGNIDLSTASGRGHARVLFAFGAMESEETSERLKGQRAEAASQGRPYYGTRPFGYNPDRATLHPVEGPAYRELFQKVIEGASLTQIAREWETRGLVNRNRVRFSVSSLRCLVHAPRAIGVRQHLGKDVATGEWEPIVSADVQEAAKAALRSRGTHLRGTNTKRPARFLSSLIVCGECGTTLRIRKQKGGVFYACDRGNNGRACGKVAIRTELAEDEVAKRFLAILTSPRTHKALEKIRRQRPDTSKILDTIDQLQLEIDAAAADLGAGRISRKVWQSIHEGTTERLDGARVRLAKVSDNPALLSISPAETVKLWDGLGLDEQRRRLAPWVNSVSVAPLNGSGGIRFVPERIKVDWRV